MEDFFSLRDRLNIFVSSLIIEKHVSLGKKGEIFFIVNVSKLLPVMWIISAHISSMNSFPMSHSSTNSSRNIRFIRRSNSDSFCRNVLLYMHISLIFRVDQG